MFRRLGAPRFGIYCVELPCVCDGTMSARLSLARCMLIGLGGGSKAEQVLVVALVIGQPCVRRSAFPTMVRNHRHRQFLVLCTLNHTVRPTEFLERVALAGDCGACKCDACTGSDSTNLHHHKKLLPLATCLPR